MPAQSLKVAVLPLDVHCSGLVTHSGEILTTGKSHKKAFKGRYSVSSKILIRYEVIEQVNPLNSLGNLISYETEVDCDNTLNNYLKLISIINNRFVPHNTLKKTRIKLYSTIAFSHKLIKSVWIRKEFPEEWKKSIVVPMENGG